MSALIEDYGLIGDLQSAALVSRHGCIDWLCLPRFDSGAIFAALLEYDRTGTPVNWRGTTRAPLTAQRVYPTTEHHRLPTWIGVGGSMESVVRAARYKLPAMYEWPEQVEDGGLMAYGPTSLRGIYARIAAYVDRILKGTKAGDLPVEQPTKLDFVINMKTAKSLGLAIPQSVVLRADRVID